MAEPIHTHDQYGNRILTREDRQEILQTFSGFLEAMGIPKKITELDQISFLGFKFNKSTKQDRWYHFNNENEMEIELTSKDKSINIKIKTYFSNDTSDFGKGSLRVKMLEGSKFKKNLLSILSDGQNRSIGTSWNSGKELENNIRIYLNEFLLF